MTKEFKDLKVGDCLYQVLYYDNAPWRSAKMMERKLRKVKISKINEKSVSFEGKSFRITEKNYKEEYWFGSIEECYKDALERHEVMLEDQRLYISNVRKEIKDLKGVLENLSLCEATETKK